MFEVLDTIALGIGYLVIGFIVGAAVVWLYAIVRPIWIMWNTEGVEVSVFHFGVVYARSDKAAKRLNHWRQTRDRQWFITAPRWFNRYIANIGGLKHR